MSSETTIDVIEHPLLDLRAFETVFQQPLGESETPGDISRLLDGDAEAPVCSNDEVRKAVRDLLRYGGFKPTGRSKPASEYLIKAAKGGRLGKINLAVDACNAVSLHSGIPVSVVDLDRVRGDLRVDIAADGLSYLFNPSGQSMDVGGLLCLFDADGPCANAVKDSQRTKTDSATTRTLTVIWGTNALPGRSETTESWYRDLLEAADGVSTRRMPIT